MSGSVHVSELTVAIKSPTHDVDTSSFSIASVGENISYTADQLDEKRENRRVYDYMCRLLEVRKSVTISFHSTRIVLFAFFKIRGFEFCFRLSSTGVARMRYLLKTNFIVTVLKFGCSLDQ